MNAFGKWRVCTFVLACGLTPATLALADDPPSSDQCNIYFKIDNQTANEVNSRVLKRHNVSNVDMPDVAPNSSDTTGCFWLENDERKSSVEVSYESGANGYFVINYVAEYKNDQISQDAIVSRDNGSDIVATYDKSKTTLTIMDAN
jgi:hypothetical protein